MCTPPIQRESKYIVLVFPSAHATKNDDEKDDDDPSFLSILVEDFWFSQKTR